MPLVLSSWSQVGFWDVYAALSLLAALGMGAMLILTQMRTPMLRRIPPQSRDAWPTISIVVAARNEERNVEQGVRSLLTLDYPGLQLTVVNDRSTDATGEILARIAAEHARLNVVTVDSLPAGWLGKNHAMQRGADASTGEWLLFTDADVVFDPSTLRRAMTYSLDEGVDHLTLVPVIETPSRWLHAFVPVFSICFLMFLKAWAVRDRKSAAYVGIGAFNLVRGSAYEAVGGHTRLALRPDDDVKLGKVLKAAGFSQRLGNGRGLLSVEWYSSFWGLVRGLEKNTFAGVDYRAWVTISACLAMVVVFLVPFVAPFLVPAPACWIFAAAAAVFVLLDAQACMQSDQPILYAPLFPVGIAIFLAINLRTMRLNLRQGGIYWRDTFYPLHELRRNIV